MENLGSFVSVNLVGSIEGFPADFVNDGDIKYFAFLYIFSVLHPAMGYRTLLFPL